MNLANMGILEIKTINSALENLERINASITQSVSIPPRRLELGESPLENSDCGSLIGDPPCLLQNEVLDVRGMSFALQLRSSDFPEKFNGIFGSLDALNSDHIFAGRRRCAKRLILTIKRLEDGRSRVGTQDYRNDIS